MPLFHGTGDGSAQSKGGIITSAMPEPEAGTYKEMYCDCIERRSTTSKKEQRTSSSYSSSSSQDSATSELSMSSRGSGTRTWICKRKDVGPGGFFGFFAWLYYWECMNCGQKRRIGVWRDGVARDDGSTFKL